MDQKTECLDIQFGMRLPWLHPTVGSVITIRAAAWSLGMDRSPRFSNMRIALEIASFSHGDIDKCSINPDQCEYCAISCRVTPWKVVLSDFEDMRKRGVEEGSLSRITVSEGLKSPHVLPLLDR